MRSCERRKERTVPALLILLRKPAMVMALASDGDGNLSGEVGVGEGSRGDEVGSAQRS